MKNSHFSRYACLAAVIIFIAASLGYSQHKMENVPNTTDKAKSQTDCPMMTNSEKSAAKTADPSSDHQAMLMEKGEKAMGFSQTKTTHNFLIMPDGGAIQVEANDSADTVNRDQIRTHLNQIALQFSKGIFTTPFAVHGEVPPGVPVMDELKTSITYAYEETGKGARVRISTNNAKALAAIHDFLRFQINEHKTGDRSH